MISRREKKPLSIEDKHDEVSMTLRDVMSNCQRRRQQCLKHRECQWEPRVKNERNCSHEMEKR